MIANHGIALTSKESAEINKLASGIVREQATDISHYVCKGSTALHRFGVNRVKASGLSTFKEAVALEWCDKLRTGTWVLSIETCDGHGGSYNMLRVAQPALTALASARGLITLLSE